MRLVSGQPDAAAAIRGITTGHRPSRVGRAIQESDEIMRRIAGMEQERDTLKSKVEALELKVKQRLETITELEEELAKR